MKPAKASHFVEVAVRPRLKPASKTCFSRRITSGPKIADGVAPEKRLREVPYFTGERKPVRQRMETVNDWPNWARRTGPELIPERKRLRHSEIP